MKNPSRHLLGFLTVLLLGLVPAVSPVGPFDVPAAEAAPAGFSEVAAGQDCAQFVNDATGVVVTQVGNDCVVTFTKTGTTDWSYPVGVRTLQVLAVGGGAGGSPDGGPGGGGGETRYSASETPGLAADATVRVVVGAGGAPWANGGETTIDFGANSSFEFRAKPGTTGGGWRSTDFGDGGSGGTGGTGYAGGNGGLGPQGTAGGFEVGSTGYQGSTGIAIRGQTEYFGGGGGGGSSNSAANSTSFPDLDGRSGGKGGGGSGAYIKTKNTSVTISYDVLDSGTEPTATLVAKCDGSTSASAKGATMGFPGLANFGGGGGGGSAYGDNPSCKANPDTADDGERTAGGPGGSGVVVFRYSLVPEVPTGVSVSSGNGKITLAYTMPTHTGGSTGSLEYSTDGGSTWRALGETDGSTDVTLESDGTTIANGELFDVRLRATNAKGYASSAVTAGKVIASPSGEVLRLDATHPESFASGDTVWEDLRGTFDATPKNGASNATASDGPSFDPTTKSFTMDGSNDWFDLPDFGVDFSSGLAIHYVVDFAEAEAWERVLEFTAGGINATFALGRSNTSDQIYFEAYPVNAVGGDGFACTSSAGAIQPGFHAYSLVIQSNGTCTHYRDGVAQGSTSNVGLVPQDAVRTDVFIGQNRSGGQRFKGSIQTIAVYNLAQTTPTCFPVNTNFTGDGSIGADGVPYTALAFTTVGDCSWAVPTGVASVDALVVAGGGGGGAHVGGGGGAGGFLELEDRDLSGVTNATVSVGRGGTGGYCPGNASVVCGQANSIEPANGGNSVFHTFTAAVGGGGGGSWTYFAPKNGGSGGGASSTSASAGSGTAGQGLIGGGYANTYWSGGGGGAGAAGGAGASGIPGAGGAGKSSSLFPDVTLTSLGVGSSETGQARQKYFAGGGGAGYHDWTINQSFTPSSGGLGGGGNGHGKSSAIGFAAKALSGGGGGAGAGPNNTISGGGDGGSGVVVIRYSTVPGAPTSLSATAGNESVALSWTSTTHLLGQTITDYVVEYQAQGQTSWTTFSDGTSASTSTTVTGLSAGTLYRFRVKSVSSAGTGEPSALASATPYSGTDLFLDFDGSAFTAIAGMGGAGVDVPDTDYTFEAWVFDQNTAPGYHTIFRHGGSGSERISLQTNKASTTNNLVFEPNSTSSQIDTGVSLPQNQWAHVAVTLSGGVWKLYLNGELRWQTSGTPFSPNSETLVRVGSLNDDGGWYWTGGIDQVKIWNNDLAQADIAKSMHTHSNSGISAASLIAHYDFNSTNTTRVPDLVGSGHLVLSSAPASSQFQDIKTESVVSGYKIITFARSYLTAIGGWSAPAAVTNANYLVVAGGGGGGKGTASQHGGGGGGGGGVVQGTTNLTTTAVPVTVGVGGRGGFGAQFDATRNGANGGNSLFDSVSATGGGGGGNYWVGNPSSGGSGGGGAISGTSSRRVGAAGTASQGNAGGNAQSADFDRNAGGGGGAGAAGGSATSTSAGAGGAGRLPTLTGITSYYGAGGGGGGVPGGQGGLGGGGKGASLTEIGGSAIPNTGSGGGGGMGAYGSAENIGGAGASGVVIVTWELLPQPSISSQPESQTVASGSNATFSVTATNAASYQWQVSTNGGGTWSNASGASATTATLTVASTTTSQNSYQYRVVVQNSDGTNTVSVTSSPAILTVQDGVTVVGATCDGTYLKNGLKVEASHGSVFYIDTGQGQEIDAGYLAYRVTSSSARTDLWVEVTDFTGGVVSLANPNDSAQPLGTVTAGGTKASYFMIKASQATSVAQSHLVKVYAQKPTIGNPAPLYTCGFTFVEVQQTIKAAANKVDSITSTTVARVGSTMTITVLGDTGTIGQGNDIDGRMIWLTPAARSNWPTDALRLERVSLDLFSNSQRTSSVGSFVDVLRVNNSTGLAANTRQYYRAVYTFRIIGPAASTAPIIPIAMISSGTQIKHTDVGSLPTGGTATVDLRTPTVDLVVTKSVSATTEVNDDGTTTLSYSITLKNNGSDTLVIDEVIDNPDPELAYLAGTSTINNTAINDPGTLGTSSLAYSGPLTIAGNSTRVISYDMTVETCAVGGSYSFDNTATARTGTVIIGSGSASQSAVNIAGNCGEEEATVTVVDEPIPPQVTTGGAQSIQQTTATITGVVDPNSQSGLAVRFVYSSTSSTLASGTTNAALDPTTFSSTGYGVTTPLAGLSPNTTYYYRLEVQDANGTWVQGEIRSFTTDPLPSVPTATTTYATSITATQGATTVQATLNGSIDPKAVVNGAKARFEWVLGTVSGNTCSPVNGETVQSSGLLQSDTANGGTEDAVLTGSSSTPMAHPVAGLTAGQTYCYRIVAFHGASFGTVVNGAWVSLVTPAQGAPEKQPQTLTWTTQGNSTPLAAGSNSTKQLTATASSNLTVTYVSNDTSVCTVNANTGLVTAVATSGNCSITATQSGNDSYYPAIPITVSFPIQPPIVSPTNLLVTEYQESGYSQTLQATGGNGTYSSWTISSGALPSGLTLNATTGVISGTPTDSGVFTFSVTTTSNGVVSEPRTFTIVVGKKPVTVTASSATVSYGASPPSIVASYSGFVGADQNTVSTGDNVAPTCVSDYVIGQNAGTTADSSCSAGWHSNYVYSYVDGLVTVTKYAVTITAVDAAKQNPATGPASADPDLLWTITSPLPFDQTIDDVLLGGVTITRDPGEVANTYYPIRPSGTARSNYDVTFVNGQLFVQIPKQIPTISVSNKSMEVGASNSASGLFGATSGTAGTFTYTYQDASENTVEVTNLSQLPAGEYTITVKFVPTDTTTFYGPVYETVVLTVTPKTVTITAINSKKASGSPDPTLTYTVSPSAPIGPVTITRAPGELPASYVISTAGGATNDYRVIHVPATFYIYEPVITVTQSQGVLTNRTVRADCRGAKPGATATFELITGNTSTPLGTSTVANDGTCPMSATLAESVAQGTHKLKIQTLEPLGTTFNKEQTIILLASNIQVINNNNGGGGGGGTTPGRNPSRPPIITPLNPGGQLPVPGPRPTPPPGTPNQGGNTLPGGPGTPPGNGTNQPPSAGVAPTPNAQTPVLPRLPGLPGLGGGTNPGVPGNSGGTANPGIPGGAGATIDVGGGVQQLAPSGAPQDGRNPAATQGEARRSLSELSSERLGGFQPGASTRIEVLGARSGARFVVSETVQVDSFTVIRAIQNSIPTQAADFFALEDVRESTVPPIAPAPWTGPEREAIGEFFEAAGLPSPLSLADIDTSGFTQWVQVTGSASTYQPGSVVYLTLTSDPLVLSSAVVADDGTVVLSGALPVEWLSAGEHRVRLVGVRSLDGVSVDDQGEIQLSTELMEEIQRFDLGTQSTIAVSGSNPEGGAHVALRVVPLVPVAPWWTLWFILAGLLLVGAARYAGVLPTTGRRILGGVVVVLAAVPAVILGWLSTVTAVTWWGLGLGLIAAVVSGIVPQSRRRVNPISARENRI